MDANSTPQRLHLTRFRAQKLSQLSCFLQVLIEARQYAADLEDSPWELAVRLGEAEKLGARYHDLRWLVCHGWIEHLPNEPGESNAASSDGEFSSTSRFIITQSGLNSYEKSHEPKLVTATHSKDAPCPHWNRERHELTLGGRLVKRFRWPAVNQETILLAFDEDGWPQRLDDPLSPAGTLDPKRRLGDTIKCLNRNQCKNLIRFRGDGTGEGVLWDALP